MCVSDALYHLASPKGMCKIPTVENQTIDLVCRHNDLEPSPITGSTCRLRNLQWHKLESHTIRNITDTGKFGMWETLPGWGMGEGEHVALLRVRTVQAEDVAQYRCRLECVEDSGVWRMAYHQASMCLRHSDPSFGGYL